MIDHVMQEGIQDFHVRRNFGFFDIENHAHLTLNGILADIIADGVDRNEAIKSVYEAVHLNFKGHATTWSRFERLAEIHGLPEAEQMIRNTLAEIARSKH